MPQRKQQPGKLHAKLASWPLDESFRDDWLNLYELMDIPSVFCRLEWLEVGIEIYKCTAQIFPYRFFDTAGELRAMGIFRLEKEPGKFTANRVLRTIEYNSQRIVPIIAATISHMTEAIITLTSHSGFRFDYLDFYKLDPMGTGLEELTTALGTAGIPHTVELFNEQPQFRLKTTWDSYLAWRTQGHRKKIRRYTSKLKENFPDYSFTRLRDPQDYTAFGTDRALDMIMRLYDQSWQADALKAIEIQHLEDLKTFYLRIARKFIPLGMLDLCLLEADGTLIAFELNLCEAGNVSMLFGSYNQEYAKYSPGNAILSEILQDSFLRNDINVDLGGEYLSYKKLWTKISTNSYHVRILGNTLKAFAKKWSLKQNS